MKRYYKILIIISLCLLVSLSTWARTPNFDSSSLFEADLRKKIVSTTSDKLNLGLSSRLSSWLQKLTQKGQLITDSNDPSLQMESRSTQNSKKRGQLVKGITFYKNYEGLDTQVNLISKDKIVVGKKSSSKLAVLPGGLIKADQQTGTNNQEQINHPYSQSNSEVATENLVVTKMNYNFANKSEIRSEVGSELHLVEPSLGAMASNSNNNWSTNKQNSEYNLQPREELETLPDDVQKIGIDYQPFDQTVLFADYLENQSDEEDKLTTTAVGLKYNNDSGKVTMKYQFENSEEEESSSAGIEVGVSDVAKLRAIYTMANKNSGLTGQQSTNDQQSETSELKSKSLDLGLDLQVNDDTSVKLGYQLTGEDKLYNESEEDLLDKIKPDAADIKLEIKF